MLSRDKPYNTYSEVCKVAALTLHAWQVKCVLRLSVCHQLICETSFRHGRYTARSGRSQTITISISFARRTVTTTGNYSAATGTTLFARRTRTGERTAALNDVKICDRQMYTGAQKSETMPTNLYIALSSIAGGKMIPPPR